MYLHHFSNADQVFANMSGEERRLIGNSANDREPSMRTNIISTRKKILWNIK